MALDYLTFKLADSVKKSSRMDPELFKKHGVKRGLRNEDGTGVLVGLTNIGNVVGHKKEKDGTVSPVPGKLYYRGYDVEDIVAACQKENRFGFEEVVYLLLSGSLPDPEELEEFRELLVSNMSLPHTSTMSIISRRGQNIMNVLARAVLELYVDDPNADDLTRQNSMVQSVSLIARFPTIIAYAYNTLAHTQWGKPLHIRLPYEELSIAENFLYMLRRDYTDLDAKILDTLLMLQAEHGGGNNSTFTVRVTSSTRTDIYSSIAAGIGSLKGPLHGGANIKVCDMFTHLKEQVSDWKDVDEIDTYLTRILNKEAYDQVGLIYGMGHGVYTISDPRVTPLRGMARELAKEKNREDELDFLNLIEERATKTISEMKGLPNRVPCNVDFYSGFIYDMIGLPVEIYTPLFAMARVAGWTAHRIEELNFTGQRIIRPAYRNVVEGVREYQPLAER
ncbi:MAG: citrate synthase [Propionibacteriaceae bacterium]|jgi:citrate synthase|nr:citrate synthase [Propionibacteriaceae bacterium]